MRGRAARTTTVFADKELAMRLAARFSSRRVGRFRHWPVEWGGTTWTVTQKHIFGDRVCPRRCAGPDPARACACSHRCCFKYGTDEQKRYYLPRILSGRTLLVPGLFRARLRFRSVEPAHPCGARRRRLRRERHEDLDDARAVRRPHLLSRAHQRARQAASRHHVSADRHGDARRQCEADHHARRRPRSESGVLRRRARAAGEPASARRTKAGPSQSTCSSSNAAAAVRRAPQDRTRRAERDRTASNATATGSACPTIPAFAARIDALEIRVMALEFAELATLARCRRGGSPGAAASLLKNISADIGQEIEHAAARGDRTTMALTHPQRDAPCRRTQTPLPRVI